MARVKGSKDGKIIKARFQGQAKSLFPTLKVAKAVVLLSITGNEFCTGSYLQAIIENAVSSFGFTTFLVADEVYWHNMRTNFSWDEEDFLLKDKAIDLGNDYLEKNLEFFIAHLDASDNEIDSIKNCPSISDKISMFNVIASDKCNFEIVTWQNWLEKSPDYCNIEHKIIQIFDDETSLRKSVEQAANTYARRHVSQDNTYDCLMQRSSKYLIEESAGVIWIASSLGYNFIAYPGEMIKPFKAAKEHFIRNSLDDNEIFIHHDEPKLFANWLEITFQRSHEKTTIRHQDFSSIVTENLNLSKNSTTELFCGVTKGIFSLDIDKQSKINLLVDIVTEYQCRSGNESFSDKLPTHFLNYFTDILELN